MARRIRNDSSPNWWVQKWMDEGMTRAAAERRHLQTFGHRSDEPQRAPHGFIQSGPNRGAPDRG